MRKIKTGVSYLDVKYNWNEKKRTVACYLKWGINLDRMPFGDMISNSIRFDNLLNNFNLEEWTNNETGETNVYAVSETVGFAYCNPDDKFDLTLGKKIALTRAQECAFEDASYFWSNCFEIFDEATARFAQISNNCLESQYKCKNHVTELTDK